MRAFSFSFENFRSFRARQNVTLSSQFLIVTGRNNSGKTNVLRSFAAICNVFDHRAFVGFDDWLYDKNLKKFNFLVNADANTMEGQRVWQNNLIQQMFRQLGSIEIPFFIDGKQVSVDTRKLAESLALHIPNGIEVDICRDVFSSWYHTRTENLIHIASDFDVLHKLQIGTIYVPSFRHITVPDAELQSFVPVTIPGESLTFHNIVATLQNFDRPSPSNLSDKGRLRRIEQFLSYCLEKEISIEVAYNRSAIYIISDGITRNLNTLGTGIEQLLIIGTAAVGFENRIVLLEEPELHLHPRAQRRMLSYFKTHSKNRFVISTHSSAIIDAEQSDILHVINDGKESFLSNAEVRRDRHKLIEDLGYRPSDIVQSNFIIWVEGPSDRVYVNHWISQSDKELIEGIDYSILFYGGRLLSHISFSDEDEDFIRVLDINNNAAIIIDSDIKSSEDVVNKTKIRIKDECDARDIMVWVTAGREVENYLHVDDLKELQSVFRSIDAQASSYDQIIVSGEVSKMAFALAATSRELNMSNLDLSAQISKLVTRIRAVKE